MSDIDLAAIVAEDAKSSAPPVVEEAAPVEETAEATTAPVEETAKEQDGDEGETTEVKPKKSGGGFQKRISELTREKHEALRREQETRELLARTTAALEAVSGGKKPDTSAQSDEPTSDQFAKYEDFVAARAEYRAIKRVEERLAKFGQQTQTQTKEQQHADKVAAFVVEAKAQAKGIEGFDDALETIRSEGFPMTQPMGDYLLDAAENKAALVKYLADNEDEAFRISRLGTVSAVKELAKVEARLSAKPKPKTSSAPPPPSTVGGGAAATQSIERMPHEALLKWVREQDARR